MAGDSPAAVISDPAGVNLATVDASGKLSTNAKIVGQIAPVEVVQTGGAPSDLSTLIRQTPANLLVDGSVTPVHVDFNADPTEDINLLEVRFMLTGQDLTLNGSKFGGSSALVNGLRIAITSNGVETEMGVVKINEDFFLLPFADILFNTAGPRDFLSLFQDYGGTITLKAGTGDRVRVTVRDNLTTPSLLLTLFETVALGIKVAP